MGTELKPIRLSCKVDCYSIINSLSVFYLRKSMQYNSIYSYSNIVVYIVLICIDQKPFEPKCPWFFIIDAYKINKTKKYPSVQNPKTLCFPNKEKGERKVQNHKTFYNKV